MNKNFEKGCESLQNKAYAKAIEYFTIVLKEEKEHKGALDKRAKAFAGLKSYDLAIKDSEKLVQLEADNAESQANHALILYLMGNKEEAIRFFNAAVKLEPNNPYRYSSRAFVKERMGDLKGALADYDRAINLDPEDSISYNNKGLIEEKLGRKEKSKSSFLKADKLSNARGEKKTFLEKQKNPKVHETKVPKGKKETVLISQASPSQKTRPEKINLSTYIKTIKELFVSNEIRREFIQFVKSIFYKKW